MTDTQKKCSATAPVNVALIKYWGKRNDELNLPAGDSLSLTLSDLRTTVTAVQLKQQATDTIEVVGNPEKTLRVIARFRNLTGASQPLRIKSKNNFPTGAGLASSASSMAALVTALAGLADEPLTETQIQELSRIGSGSAVRSLKPGYVHWQAGSDPQGADCIADTVFPAEQLPLKVLAVIIESGPKPLGSTEAMIRCRDTSPFYNTFLKVSATDLTNIQDALAAKDLANVALIAEANALALHAVAMTANPPIVYFKPATVEVLETVQKLRAEGAGCFFTIDAGPNVFVFCSDSEVESVKIRLAEIPGVKNVIVDKPGLAAAVTGEHLF